MPLRLEVPQDDIRVRRRRCTLENRVLAPVGEISSTSGVWWHMPTQPTRFTTAGAPVSGQCLLDRSVDLAAALGDAAGAKADANFAQLACREPFRAPPGSAADSWRCWRKSSSTLPTVRGREMAVGDAVDLHDGGQRAAAEAGDFLDGEQAVGVGVAAGGDAQPPLEGVLDQLRALHVAGRAVADVDDVLADRMMAKLRVERGDADDAGGRDLGELRRPARSLRAARSDSALDRLQDRDHGIAAATEPLNNRIDGSQIEIRH